MAIGRVAKRSSLAAGRTSKVSFPTGPDKQPDQL